MASKPETTKGLGLEERAIFSEIFPSLLNSTSSSCMSWVDSEETDNNSSLFDESSPSESSISTGYFPCYQIHEDISDKSVHQKSVTNEKVCEKSDSDHSGKDNQNKDWPDRGIVIKYIITDQDNKITVSKRDLVTSAKDLKPSDLTVIEENFLGKMDFNIHKKTWQKIEWNHQKSLPTLEKELLERRHRQRKFKPQFKQQAKPQAKPQARSQAKPSKPQTKPQAKSQARRNELWRKKSPRTQSSHGDPPPLSSRLSFHRLFQWFRQTFTRRTRVNPLGENMQPEAAQEQPRSWGSRSWGSRSWGSRLWRCLSLKRFRSGNQVQPYSTRLQQ